MKKILFILTMVMSLVLTGCNSEKVDENINLEELPYFDYLDSSNPEVSIVFEDDSVIKIELFPEVAPNTVNNFISLIEDDFYNDVIFHRIIEDFMIQGGDPEGTGMGGADYNIVGEFTQNNFENDLSHYRGVISMARSQAMNSASSQFFIVHQDSDFLDGAYASFGGMTSGFNVLDTLATTETDSNDKPTSDIKIKEVVVDKKGINYDQPIVLNKDFVNSDNYSNSSNPVVELTFDTGNTLEIELFPEVAPLTVEAFLGLVSEGHFDNMPIYQIIKGVAVLVGDEDTFEDSDSVYGEYQENGYNNILDHHEGVISMLRNSIDTSFADHFFIVIDDASHLNGSYAAFGVVTKGLEYLEEFNDVEISSEYKPTTEMFVTSVKIK